MAMATKLAAVLKPQAARLASYCKPINGRLLQARPWLATDRYAK